MPVNMQGRKIDTCPYCGQRMKLGYIRGSNPRVAWVPYHSPIAQKRWLPVFSRAQQELALDYRKNGFQKYKPVESWRCDNCCILITYTAKNSQ